MPLGTPGRNFRCRVCLCYWTGDHPAQAKSFCMSDKSCHWCLYKSEPAPEVNRRAWGGFRRWLPEGDQVRRPASMRYGPEELEGPPPTRTHEQIIVDGLNNEAHTKKVSMPDARKNKIFKKNAPYKQTGVRCVTPFRYLPLMDLTWDCLPCLMHGVPAVYGRHFVAMMQGSRMPEKPKMRKSWSVKENEALLKQWHRCKEEISTWVLSKEEGKAMDARSLALAGEPAWVRSNVEVFSGRGLTAHDWIVLVQTAGDYIFANLYPDRPERVASILALKDTINDLLRMECPWDDDDRADANSLKLRLVEALCDCESVLPVSELPVLMHTLVHVPDCVYRWGKVRNFWSFFGERYVKLFVICVVLCRFVAGINLCCRHPAGCLPAFFHSCRNYFAYAATNLLSLHRCMGYYIRFIHNRDLAYENMARAVVRSRFLLDAPPGALQGILGRLSAAGLPSPSLSLITSAADLRVARGALPGEGKAEFKPSRRNSVNLNQEDKGMIFSNALLRKLDLPLSAIGPGKALIAGVRLNGRPYKQGDHCEYIPLVRPRHNLAGPGGLEGSDSSRRIATINMFYAFEIENQATLHLVDLTDIPVEAHYRKMSIVSSVRAQRRLPGFDFAHGSGTLIHIDAMSAKIMLVPHFEESQKDTMMIAIPIWEAV